MSITLDLSADVEARLQLEAERQHRPVADLAGELLAQALPDIDPNMPAPLPPDERNALIDRLMGAYAHLPTTVDDYIQEKRSDA